MEETQSRGRVWGTGREPVRAHVGAQEAWGAPAEWEATGVLQRTVRVGVWGGVMLLPAGGQQHLGSPVPARGHVICQGLALRPLREVTKGAGETEVAELHQAAGVQENVGRLQGRRWAELCQGWVRTVGVTGPTNGARGAPSGPGG